MKVRIDKNNKIDTFDIAKTESEGVCNTEVERQVSRQLSVAIITIFQRQ